MYSWFFSVKLKVRICRNKSNALYAGLIVIKQDKTTSLNTKQQVLGGNDYPISMDICTSRFCFGHTGKLFANADIKNILFAFNFQNTISYLISLIFMLLWTVSCLKTLNMMCMYVHIRHVRPAKRTNSFTW